MSANAMKSNKMQFNVIYVIYYIMKVKLDTTKSKAMQCEVMRHNAMKCNTM